MPCLPSRLLKRGKKVLVLERRDHIGGNCYSYNYKDSNINIPAYGTHIFHTNDDGIWQFVNRFTKFNRYQHRVLTTHNNQVFSMPINLGTINAFYGVKLQPYEVDDFLRKKKGTITKPKNLEEQAINLIGEDLYRAFIQGYTMKQWGCDPKDLPASVIKRLPVRNSYHDGYFNDYYQGIPLEGYTPMFERMLANVDVELGVDYFEDSEQWNNGCKKLVYTGPIDRFFGYQYGRLNWRSVRFEIKDKQVDDYQGCSVMNYADTDVSYTRIHEPKHLHLERKFRSNTTVIIREYSQVDNDEPYYPVNFDSDKELLKKYQLLQKEVEDRVVFGGRLASYKYYDMHQVIGQALSVAARELSE